MVVVVEVINFSLDLVHPVVHSIKSL